MRSLRSIRLGAAFLVVLALAGCQDKPKKKAGAANRGPDLMTPVERKRGEDACTMYNQQACGCALPDKCRDSQVKLDALESLTAVDLDPGSSEDSRLRVQVETRKLIAKCVMEHASLPALGCH